MSIDRIGTFANTQILLAQLRSTEGALNATNNQVATGKVSTTYAGFGSKTATLEAARSTVERIKSDIANTQEAQQQLDLQDTQVTQLADLATEVRQAMSDTLSTNDGTALMNQMQGFFDRATEILNVKNGGTYLFGGDKTDTPPVNVSTLTQLAALGSPSAAFDNGTVKRSIRIGEGQTMETGMLASDLGTQLFTMFRDVAQFAAGPSGSFGSTLNDTQQTFLTGAIQTSIGAATDLNAQAATNGFKYQSVQQTQARLTSASNVYKGFVSDIENVDMPEAVSRLNQNQVMVQAALQVTANLNQMSLLNYLQ